ncbi:hypothetical protein WDU94_015030 [Cyamophila willieti]
MRSWLRLGLVQKLEQILLHGQGHKLLSEHSSNQRTVRFLKKVPHYMASGLGFKDIVEYLLSKVDNINQADSFGRTPLHYAAMKSGNMEVYKLLKSHRAIDNIQDSKRKLPKHYLTKPSDRPEACLSFVPSAPRTVDQYPMSWDWDLYNTKPRVMPKSRSSLQADKEIVEDFENPRKTKSEGNLHKIPVKRKVKKMFEENFPVPAANKPKTDTLNMEEYTRLKSERKQRRQQTEDTTTTDSDIEDNIDSRVSHHRSRSKTIGGPIPRKYNGASNELDTNLIEQMDKSVSETNLRMQNSVEIGNKLANSVQGHVRQTNRSASKETIGSPYRNMNDYRTSYRNYPMFESLLSNEYRQPFSSNYEGTPFGTPQKPYATPPRYENTRTPLQQNNTNNDARKSAKKENFTEMIDETREKTALESKEEQQVMDESSSTDQSSIVSNQEPLANDTKGNLTKKEPPKRRRKQVKRDDSRIIVNTFNSIEDMQKSVQDEEIDVVKDNETMNKPKEIQNERKDKDIEKTDENADEKYENDTKAKDRVIVNTFNSIEDMRKLIEEEEQEIEEKVKTENIESSQLQGDDKQSSENGDDQNEKYNELYYEQKPSTDNLEQNKINNVDDKDEEFDISEFEYVSFSKLIKDRSNSSLIKRDENVNRKGEKLNES